MIHRSDIISPSDKLSIYTYCWVYTPRVWNTHNSPLGWPNVEDLYAKLNQTQTMLLRERPDLKQSYQTIQEFVAAIKPRFLHCGGDPIHANIERND